MQSGAVAKNLAFIEYDFALINAHHGPQLIVEESLSAVFKVFREQDPVADRELDFLPLNFRAWWSGNRFSTPAFPTMTSPSSRRRTSLCSPLLKRFSLTPLRTAPFAIL